jgi:hypothetical protein
LGHTAGLAWRSKPEESHGGKGSFFLKCSGEGKAVAGILVLEMQSIFKNTHLSFKGHRTTLYLVNSVSRCVPTSVSHSLPKTFFK